MKGLGRALPRSRVVSPSVVRVRPPFWRLTMRGTAGTDKTTGSPLAGSASVGRREMHAHARGVLGSVLLHIITIFRVEKGQMSVFCELPRHEALPSFGNPEHAARAR